MNRFIARVRHKHTEEGLSLVETMAALLVFGIMTLGLVPLLATSIRGSDISRKASVGKQVANEAMERVRGFPFYIDYAVQARKVDVLDLYFPSRTPAFAAGTCTGYLNTGSVTCTSSNYAATGPAYVTTCPDASNIACPQNIPSGYTLTYEASFVNVAAGTPETYTKTEPATTYAYTSVGNDRPQTLLVQMIVNVRWTDTGRGTKTYQIRSLLSDRKFSGLKLLGDAAVDFGVQFVAGYSPQGVSQPAVEITATGGNAVSHIESRRVAAATQSVRAGEIVLIDTAAAQDTDDTNDFLDTTPRLGVDQTLAAPPDVSVGPINVTNPADVFHPDGAYNMVGQMDSTFSTNISAATANSLPAAAGDFRFSSSVDGDDLLITNDRADIGNVDLQLDETDEWIARVVTKASDSLRGSTSSTTNALGTQPGVASQATVSFKELHLFRTDYIDDIDDQFDGAVIAITGRQVSGSPAGVFSATATCNADNDGTPNSTAASVTYSGTLWYWYDPEQDDEVEGHYESVDLGTGTDVLSPIQSGGALLVYDHNNDNKDVYLFANGSNPYYLTNWTNTASGTTSVEQNGRVTSARIDKGVSIETAPVEGLSEPDTAISVGVGSVNCKAEDYR